MDHAPVRGVTPPKPTKTERIVVVDYDRCEVCVWHSWENYRQYQRVAYLFGEDAAQSRFEKRTISKGAREPILRLQYENDFRAVRGLMHDAQLAVDREDTR